MPLPALTTAESAEVEQWNGRFSAYDRAFASWEKRVEKIIKRYRDDRGEDSSTVKGCRFNILWSNVQTLSAATFARVPQPDVSRRFKDRDPVGRVASLILERALEYEVTHYPDYRATMKASVLDRFLGGRATSWARYDPRFKTPALQVSEDASANDPPSAAEELDYECAPTDYVHYKDFGHTLARTWEEVTAVWRNVYMGREALVKRFGEELGKEIPLDSKPEHLKNQEATGYQTPLACIKECWDRTTEEAVWISKSLGRIVDRRKDPLGLEEFFPCAKPMYATLANDNLIPTPDFALYQYQADQLDTLSNRIEGLVDAMKVMGVYDGSITELGRIFQEGVNTALFPIKNWAAYAEKGKLAGAIELVDLKPIYEALRESYMAMDQIKQQIYEITRISDIMRGVVDPREKLGQTEIKGQYGNLGIKAYQDQVSEYATDLLRLKAQIICNKFSPETLLQIAAAGQLSEHDQKLVPQAIQLLLGPRAVQDENGAYPDDAPSPNPLRSFRIDIAADSLVHTDEEAEKDARMSFISANSAFMKDAIMTLSQAGPMAAPLTPLVMELWSYGVAGFKVGKSVEGAFDEATEKIQQLLAQQPKLPPEVQQKMQELMEGMQKLQQENMALKTGAAEKQAQLQVDTAETAARLKQDHETKMAELAMREREQNEAARLDREKAEAKVALDAWIAEQEILIEKKKQDDAASVQQQKVDFDRECRVEDRKKEAAETADLEVKPVLEKLRDELIKAVEDVRPVSVKTVKDAQGNITGGIATYANGDTRNVTIQ